MLGSGLHKGKWTSERVNVRIGDKSTTLMSLVDQLEHFVIKKKRKEMKKERMNLRIVGLSLKILNPPLVRKEVR